MKKTILTIAIVISGLFVASQLVTACNTKKEQATEEGTMESDSTSRDEMKMDSTTVGYACPMHAEITGKEGDKCSKCGMKLEALISTDTIKHQH